MKPFGRALTLALLSAVTAEFLLGDQWLSGAAPLPQQFGELLLFTAFYGSAAVLIREFARRTGRGWPTILLAAFAFGVIEEGMVDQSLFNPDFAGAHLLTSGFIPGIGIGGPWTIFVLTLHVVWSIGSPIAIAEALYPHPVRKRRSTAPAAHAPQAQAPWLGAPGLVVAGVLCLVGGTAIMFATTIGAGYMAKPWQLAASLVVAVAALVVGFRLPKTSPRAPRSIWPAAAVAVVFTSGFTLVQDLPTFNPWLTCLSLLAVLGVGALVTARFRLDTLGLAAGAILTYGWVGMQKAVQTGTGPAIEQSVLVLLVLATVAVAARRRATAGRSGSRRVAADPVRSIA